MGFNNVELNLPKYPSDRVIGILEGSFVFDENIFNTGMLVNVPTGINDTVWAEGIFTLRSSPSYQSMDTTFLVDGDVGNPVFVYALILPGVIKIFALGQPTVIGFILNYRIVLIAKRDQGVVDIKDTAYLTSLTSKRNYRKIFLEDVVPISLPLGDSTNPPTTTYVIPHNLGYYPSVKAFIEQDNVVAGLTAYSVINVYRTYNPSVGQIPNAQNFGNIEVHVFVDTKNVTFYFLNFDIAVKFNLQYRIYYDKH